jgi:ribonuclease HI
VNLTSIGNFESVWQRRLRKGKILILYVDGSARPNPGPASIGAVIEDERGHRVSTLSRSIGRATNNEAEYLALLSGLEMAATLPDGPVSLEVRSDSELLVRQLQGRYRVKKAELVPLHSRAVALSRAFPSFTIVKIPRRQNRAHTQAELVFKP